MAPVIFGISSQPKSQITSEIAIHQIESGCLRRFIADYVVLLETRKAIKIMENYCDALMKDHRSKKGLKGCLYGLSGNFDLFDRQCDGAEWVAYQFFVSK